MVRLLKQIIGNEKGQALPIVLALLAFGGLVIVPVLDNATTSLRSGQAIEKSVKGICAADAGVENALWCLINDISPSEQLPENINQMEVAIQTVNNGIFTLYFGGIVELEYHVYLNTWGEFLWDEGAETYKYVITVEVRPEAGGTNIQLEQVGVRLPIGYGYQTGSSALFAENMATYDPDVVVDSVGANMLNWGELDKVKIDDDDPVATQTFYVTGQGNQEGDYTWVESGSSSIGLVGQYSGDLYEITATATCPEDGTITAKIVADVLIWREMDTADIITWLVSK